MNWQKIKKDLLWAASSHLFHKMIGFFILMILARYLDKARMGEFFFATTLASFFALFTDLGMNTSLIREIAVNPDKPLQHLSKVISLRLPLIGFSFLLLSTITFIFKPQLITIVLLTSVYIFLQDFYQSFGAFFLGLRRVAYRVVTILAAQFLLLGFIMIVVSLKGSLNMILACYILANAILIGITVTLVFYKIGRFRLVWDLDAARDLLQMSLPFFLLTILELVHFKVDTLMLGFMQSYTAVATYEAGYRLLEVSRFVVRPAAMIFFPLCSGIVARKDWPAFHVLFRKLLWVTAALGLGVTVVVVITAGFIIPAIFGAQYEDAVPILRVLYLTVPALYLGFVSTFLANAMHLEKKAIKIMLLCVIINVMLNSFSIPRWGALGAAWATVISETLLTFWLLLSIVQTLRSLPAGPQSRYSSTKR